MADDLNTQLVFGANTAGAEAGVRTVKRSLKDLADSAAAAGKSIEGTGDKAGKSLAGIGNGGEAAARKIQRDTSAMRGSLQRYLASLEAGSKDSRRYWETMADFKGIDRNALAPLLNQLDAYNAKTKEAAESTASWTGGLSRIGAGVAGMAAITATVGVAAKAMFDASVSAERLRTMLDFSTGGNSAKEIEYLRGITYRLGLEFTSTAKAYSQFSAAAKGTALEGDKARAVFESVAKASSVMGLSAADTSGVLLALQQMISKGTVQAEELRGQLGERLPGAFQIAAKAMGVTTGELGKMLEQGQVIADDFLPKFAAALDKNLGGAAEKAANRLDASVNRLSTAWDRLKQNSGDSGVSSFMAGQYEILADGFNGVSEAMERARGSGSGFIGQMAAGAVAAAKFANPLQAVSYSAIETGNALKQAEAEFAALQKRGDVMGGNIYYRAEMANLAALIKELKAAQAEKQKLATGAAPNMNEGVIASGRAREAYMTQRAKDEEAANAFRLNLAGVPASYVKEMQELIRLNQAGIIVGDEYTAALKKQQDLLLKKTTTVRGSAAAANAEQNAYESLISSIRAKIEADNLEIAGGAALTESQRLRIKLDQDLAAGRVKLSAQNERAVRLALEELKASEASALAAKTLAKANLDAAASREKYLTSLDTGLDKIRADIAAQIEATERMGLSKEAIAELDAAKLEMLATDLELQAIKAMDRNLDQQTYDALKKQAAAYRELGIAKKGGAAKEAALEMEKANAEAAKKAQEDWERASEQINSTLTDALMRGFESGKDFAKNLRDTVVNMFKTLVLRPIISAVLSPISGGIQGLMGGVGGAGGSNPIGMASNAYSLYNTGSQAWTLGSQYLSGSMSGANVLGSAYGNFTGAGLDGLLATNGAYGTAGGGAAGGVGMSGMAGAGVFAAVVGVVLNALGAFRSERRTGSGLMGTLGSGDLSPWEEWREGGTLFSGPSFSTMNPVEELERAREQLASLRAMNTAGTLGNPQHLATQQSIVDELERLYGDLADKTKAQSDAIQNAYDALRTNVGDMADVLGLSSDAVRAFTTSLGVDGKGLQFDGLNADQVAGKIAEALATANNELAQQVIGSFITTTTTPAARVVSSNIGSEGEDRQIVYSEEAQDPITSTRYVESEYAKEGEKAIDTLTRLATSLSSVNTIWENLGFTLYDASLRGADAASKMADAFGGLENLAAVTGVYYENFYSDAEKTANITRDVTKALAGVGLELPKTRQEFRSLVEAQIALGESGTTAVKTLLEVSGAFASITEAVGRAMDSAALERADRLAAQREQEKQAAEALQKQIEAYADGAEQFNVLRDSLLKAGDAAGLLAAVTERAFADPSGRYMDGRYELPRWESTDTAASFNYRYGEMQARMRQQLGDEASANALRIQDVRSVLQSYSVEQMMSEYDPVTGALKLAVQQGIVDASGDLGFAVRDAVQGAALYAAMADVRGQFTSNGPGLASIAAARATAADASRTSIDPATGLYRIGGAAVEYGKALDSLQGYMRSGAIDADTFERAVEALGAALPGAAESVGTLEDLVAAVQGASYMVGQAGLASIRYYFGSLSDLTAEFALAAAEAQEPIAQTTAAIGRLNSAQYAFAESATATLQGFGGGGVGGAWMLQDAGVMKDINRAQLIAEAAGIASAAMTTADAAAAAAKLAQSPAFAELTAQGIRDASLLLDGVGQYNADGFERAFIRISDALAKGNVTDAQYKTLFDVALDMFEGVPEETRTLIDSMTRLRDAMRGFADGLLIDEQRTTLSAGATLAEMQRQYAQAFAGAATGDNDAIGKYQQLANTLLDKGLYSTQAEYNAAFGSVYGDARQLEAIGVNTLANAQGNEMVSELKDMNAKLNKRVEDLEKNLMAALAQIAKNTSDTSRGIEQQIVMAEGTP